MTNMKYERGQGRIQELLVGGSRAKVARDILGGSGGYIPLDFFFTQKGSDIDISNK